jgi:holo-[acyl-carrier protein] synthase
MIVGLGVDLCSVSRMEKAIRSDYFVRRLFRSPEIAYADAKGNAASRAASFASAFAAREAFAKASGISMYKIALSSQICLERTNGVPSLVISPDLDAGFVQGEKRTWVSLSHDGDYAVAVVVIEAL